MMYYTHLAFGVLVSLLSLTFFNIKNKIIFIVLVIFFSIFPDIDEERSWIGRKNKLISKIVNLIFGHRGFFHSIYIPILLFLILLAINIESGLAVFMGYLSHIFVDALTKSGIRPYYPIINTKIHGFIKTNSFSEKILFLIIVFADLYISLNYIFGNI
jgi:inner membrane protein